MQRYSSISLSVLLYFLGLLVCDVHCCFGSSSSGSTTSSTSSPYQSSNNLPNAQAQTSTPIANTACGHSQYWNSGEYSLSIVGGTTALPNEFPYQARLQFSNSKLGLCGAAIVSSNYVLTAAHCCITVSTSSPGSITIVVGDQDKTVIETGEKNYTCTQIVQHPSYNSATQEYDFCLLKLNETLTWSKYVQPVCLASSCSQECSASSSDNVTITGWGATSELNSDNAITSNTLQKAVVPVVSTTTCSTSYAARSQTITDNMLCAGYVSTGGIDACQGDSGGPMVCAKSGYFQLDGVTSFGNGCARVNYPGVYARVCKVLSWITSTISGSG